MELLLGLIGGIFIGLGAVVLMANAGRIAGISGIVGGTLNPQRGDVAWRLAFIVGLIGGAFVVGQFVPQRFEVPAQTGALLVLAGLLVGIGTGLSNGCTSGHGVCGLARFSGRSAVAVGTFMLFAILTTGVLRHVF